MVTRVAQDNETANLVETLGSQKQWANEVESSKSMPDCLSKRMCMKKTSKKNKKLNLEIVELEGKLAPTNYEGNVLSIPGQVPPEGSEC